jgi:hypothetical protein
MGWLVKGLTMLFGSSSNGKGVVGQVSDAVDRWSPSAQTQHENSIEDLQAGDASQASARSMVLVHHDSWFDIFIDGMNRSVRPVITFWVVGVLIGWWEAPRTDTIDPIVLNIMWTVITFWFGSRVVFKDVPNAIAAFKAIRAKAEVEKAAKRRERQNLPEPFPED